MKLKAIGFGLAATAAMTALASVFAQPAQAAAFTNGSFEVGSNPGTFITLTGGSTAINGWTVTGGSIDYIGSYWEASNGSRSLDLSGFFQSGGIKQTFDTVIGQTYKVLFDIAGNPDGNPIQKVLSAVADPGGSSQEYQFDITGKTKSNMGWITKSYLFTATSTSTTLSFSTPIDSAFGAALDNVQVTAVPTPALLPGLIGMGVAALRKKRKDEEFSATPDTVEECA